MDEAIYRERRRRVLEALGDGVLVAYAADETIRNNDVHHPFRQDSDFHYLSGFDEPESVLVLEPGSEAPFTLFVRPRDPEKEQWTGERAGPEGARERFGADAAFPLSELELKLSECFTRHERLYFRFRGHGENEQQVMKAVASARQKARRGGVYPVELIDPECVIHPLRRIKGEREIRLMSEACDITREAHLEAMKSARPGQFEYELEATLRDVFRRRGASRVAYEPIVATGNHANVLHYVQNDSRMQDGELVLVDAGCEYEYYAADVTRTYPVNGRFSPAQRDLYAVVLAAQKAAIDQTGPGKTLGEIHQAAVRTVCEGLLELGILRGSVDQIVSDGTYKKYFMHRTSHYLGMDVHDVGRYYLDATREVPLEPGVVITVEPGLYCAASNADCPEPFRGIGIRIEDDILIEASGARVLSTGIPKELAEVEQACTS